MEHFRPVRGMGLAASVLIGLVALLSLADAVSSWYSYSVVKDYFDGAGSEADLNGADAIALAINGPLVILYLAAAIVFMLWLFRARSNAERLTYAQEHRRSRPWCFWGWVVPIVHLWFPKQIIDDIWCASDPDQQTVPLQQRQRNGLVTAWWAAFLVMLFMDRIMMRSTLPEEITPEAMQADAILSTVTTLATVVAAVLGALVVARISDSQSLPVTPTSAAPAPAA